MAFGAIGVAVVGILALPATGGVSAVASGFMAPAAVGILGIGATSTAIGIAVAAGGVAVLNKLRKYRLEKISDTHIILRKK